MTNKELFETYIVQNLDSIYRFAYTYTRNQAEAEDVVNDSILKALKAINTLKSPEYIGTWFYRIVANTALNQYKRNKKMIYLEHDDLAVFQDNKDDHSDLSFEQMIEILEPKYKSIVILRFFEDRTLEEISSILEENLNTVKTRLYKALKLLRLEMEGEYE